MFTKVYLVGWLVSWRWVCWLCCPWPLLLMVAFALLPESPYWLAHHGRGLEALSALRWYRYGYFMFF
jgi:hypothetical protein